jgi:hypothetical protein
MISLPSPTSSLDIINQDHKLSVISFIGHKNQQTLVHCDRSFLGSWGQCPLIRIFLNDIYNVYVKIVKINQILSMTTNLGPSIMCVKIIHYKRRKRTCPIVHLKTVAYLDGMISYPSWS